MVNRQKIQDLKRIALSQSQIQNNTTRNIPILSYDEIYGKSLDHLTRKGACILLYLISENYGHWCSLVRVQKDDEPDHLIYFDSYGRFPDEPLTWSSPEKNEELGQGRPYLLEKIVKHPDRYQYWSNPHELQNWDDTSIQTCGRHQICFLHYCWTVDNPSVDGFKEWLDQMKEETGLYTYDQVVTYLTDHIEEP